MDEYKTLNNVQTHLITWNNPFESNGSDVIVLVTGSPGIPEFYKEFAAELHKNTGLPVCLVGHAGHDEVPDEDINILKTKSQLFTLQGQIEHKLDLIINYVDGNSKLHLIGHSIGAWMLVELLHKYEDLIERVSSVHLLFPTLQKMAETRNGSYINNVVKKLHSLILFLFTLSQLLPKFTKIFFISIYLMLNSLPFYYYKRLLIYLNPKVEEKVLFLAYNSLDRVTKLNSVGIDKIKHITNVIYSNIDKWVPVDYIDDLRVFQPHIQLKQMNVEHAFVLKSSSIVAKIVSEFIKIKLGS